MNIDDVLQPAMNASFSELVAREAAKRERNWDPKLRWQVLQETITWAESQATVRRNTKEACLANQRRLFQQIEAWEREQRNSGEPSK